jgi:predicted ATPase/DNA-binding SARP family transcriptional activator
VTRVAGGRLEIRLLGPLEARIDEVPVGIGGQRPRALLAVLALSAGAGVSTERLIDTIWDDAPPAGAANSVQVYVSRLRKTLQPTGQEPILRSVAGGYLLDIPRDAIDVLHFERLAAAGHDALSVGDAQAAAQLLSDALSLWRGPALADLEGATALGLVARLEARRLATRMDLVDAEIALGQHTRAIPELEELVRLHPLDEGLVRRLMTALYLSGRQADALAAYTTAAHRLADELGVDPGPDLRQAHGEVLRHEMTAPKPPAASALSSMPGGTAGGPAAAHGTPSPTGRDDRTREREILLRPRGNLIGRQEELVQVLRLLGDPEVRLVSLLGPGGMGKTRLALAVAEAINGDSGAATPVAVVVPLSTVTDDGELLASICQTVGAEPEWAGQPTFDVIVRGLAGRRMVLVLDNLEQLIDSPGTLEDVMGLLDQLPLLTVLCTSRVALRLGRERQVVLGPLSLPELADDSIDGVRGSAAVQLFQDRASAVVPGFEVTVGNARAVAEICRLLDGQPLALELAAARTRMLPPEEMVQRSGQLLALLTGGGRDLPERQRSMRAALDWSAQLLDPAEAEAFAQLSVFSGGWTLAAAEAVCAADVDLLEVLARLVDKSLVAADTSGRLFMLETVQEYAAERLAALGPDQVSAAKHRHAEVYADLAAELGPQFRTSPSPWWPPQIDAEAGNFSAALEWALRNGDDANLGRMVLGLIDYWFFTGRIVQAERWLAAADRADLPMEIRIRLGLSTGGMAFVHGDVERAGPAFAASVETARRLGDHLLLARSLTMSSLAARHSGRLDEALALIDEAITAARAGARADPESAERLDGLVFQLGNERGEILEGLGRSDEARTHFEAYRQQSVEIGDHGNLAWALGNIAMNESERGQPKRALEYAHDAVRAADEDDSMQVRADARGVAGLVELMHGEPARAVGLLAESVRLTHSTGQLLTLPDGVSLLGAALLQAGDLPGAARMLAAGQAWRSAKGLAIVGRLADRAINQAHDDLAALPLSQVVKAESARGAAIPYGRIGPLELPESVDLRDADQGPVLRLVEPGDEGISRRNAAAARAGLGSRD